MRPGKLSIPIALSYLWLLPAAIGQDKITEANSSVYIGGGRWAWTVGIQAPAGTVRSIRCVEYTLHPSFPNPVRQVCEPGNGPQFFPLSSEGWGTFQVPIKVQFREGQTQTLNYRLRFDPPQVQQAATGVSVDNVARRETQTTWNWTVFLKGSEEALSQVRCVEYTLHPTFPDPVREVCNRGKGPQAFALSATGWGSFTIGVRVFLKNGQLQQFTHQLRF
jgi:transcription initiation factor IIF auxiliary subunit